MVQAPMNKYDIIGLTETRRHESHHAVFDTGEELFLGTCDKRGVGGVGVLVNTNLAKSIDSFECLTTRIGHFHLNRCGSLPAVSIFVVYAPTSHYDEREIEKFYMELEKFYKEDHTFYKITVGDFNAKIGPRRSAEELHIGTHGLEWNEQGERLSEFIMSTKTIHGNSQFQKAESKRWTWESPGGRFHNEIDHIIFNRWFCLTDVAVVPKFRMGSDHRHLAPELRRRKRAAWKAFKNVEEIAKRTKNLRLRAHLFDSTVLPALTYASETWPLCKQDENAIQVSQRRIERAMLGISRFTQMRERIRSSDIHRRSRIRDAVSFAKVSKIRWAGHVMRFKDDRWTRAVTDWIPRDVKRPRGRPPTRWSDFFVKIMNDRFEALHVPGANRCHWATLACNRDKWRRYWRPLEQIDD
ncbi:uncharacterized protein LOC130017907 [Sorex fumeus]|uniref:uncharacterized protein LOC130017907 n=1 Tax=Sorex fumeus TaxID=62283 RepID=UPI0024AD20C9|nr:uncharacterized protein LOC130017907 [Sorex fumeus]